MRLGLLYGFSHSHDSLDLVLEAERLGYDSVWTGEAWGSDTIVPLAWIGALTKKSASARRSCRCRRVRPR